MRPPLLEVQGLTLALGDALMVEAVSVSIGAGRVHALVGESGSGKTVTALALLGLLPEAIRVTAGVLRLADEVSADQPDSEPQFSRAQPEPAPRPSTSLGVNGIPQRPRETVSPASGLGPICAQFSVGRGPVPGRSSVESGSLDGLGTSGAPFRASGGEPRLRGAAPLVPGRDRAKAVEVTLPLSDAAGLAHLRGRAIAMVPSDPLLALNPVLTAGQHLTEALGVHLGLRGAAARSRAAALLGEVGIAEPEARLDFYPHQFSGGMRQRVLLAAALAGEPRVLIADEPTSSLDAPMQGVVLSLLRRLAATRGLAVLCITHDLAVVRDACDELSVLYAGRLVEQGPAAAILAAPRHPYTRGLLAARPAGTARGQPLPTLEGSAPSPAEVIAGCRFHPRCALATARCRREGPTPVVHHDGRSVACHEAVDP